MRSVNRKGMQNVTRWKKRKKKWRRQREENREVMRDGSIGEEGKPGLRVKGSGERKKKEKIVLEKRKVTEAN